jgi:uncharacterized protein YbjT (DUF2867 family)
MQEEKRAVLVTGARGFIGRALVPALLTRGYPVVAATRKAVDGAAAPPGLAWRTCDLLRAASVAEAMRGTRVAYYLVHSMGRDGADYAERDRRAAHIFAAEAARANLERIIYLGGPTSAERLSEHLRSRAEVGEILRGGAVPAIELRASMVIGHGGASWQVVRDLAKRLPIMILPRWLESKTRPVALEDVLAALLAAAELPIPGSVAYDIPGPDTLSGRQILERIAALEGREIPALEVPLLTPRLSAAWLRLVTGADYQLARELVGGLTTDLLPESEAYWELIGHDDLISFDEAARRALEAEPPARGVSEALARLEERLVRLTGRRPRGARPGDLRPGETP